MEFEVTFAFETHPISLPRHHKVAPVQIVNPLVDTPTASLSGLFRLRGRDQHHSSLSGEKQEGKGFLQI